MSILCIACPFSELDTTTWEAMLLREDFEARIIVQCIRNLSVCTPIHIFRTHKEIYNKVVDDII